MTKYAKLKQKVQDGLVVPGTIISMETMDGLTILALLSEREQLREALKECADELNKIDQALDFEYGYTHETDSEEVVKARAVLALGEQP